MTTEENALSYLNDTITSVILNDTTTSVSLRKNCSVYNPCGRYGDCRNKLGGEWKCVCKFWWNGTLCNELSSSGTQVIVTGVMLGVLIAVFHGLALFHSIRKKRKLSKIDSKQNIPNNHRTPPITTVLDPSRRIVSFISGILTVILATSTLLIKWSILKPIHEEIVNKYINKQPLFFKRHSICRIIDLRAEFNLFTFPVACLLILIFIIASKRASFQRNKYFKGYIGVPVPLDFFAHVKRTLAAVIFAIFADELLGIAVDAVTGGSSSPNQGIIVRYLIQILKVFIIGFRRYPILAAVYMNNYLSLICATLYVWLDFSVTIVHTGLCLSDFYSTDLNYNTTGGIDTILYFNYYGTGSKLLFLQLLTDIPRYLCFAYISIKLPMLLIKRIRYRKLTNRQLTREQKNLLHSSLPYSAESRYVKKLFGLIQTEPPTNRFVKISQYIYAWRDDFRYSSRIICVYTSIFLMLFFLTVEACIELLPLLAGIRDTLQKVFNVFSSIANPPDPNLQEERDPSSNFRVPDIFGPFLFSVFAASLIIVAQLLVMLAGIRRNLLQAFRGDDCEIPRRVFSQNVSYITGNFHFAGYLIGYVILNYIFLIFIILLITSTISAFITYGSVISLEKLLKLLIPGLLFAFFKVYLNKFLGQYVFLQHNGDVLSTNNRRAFMVFLYFNFFLDAFLGLFAAVSRILKSVIGGVIYLCRLDYSPLGRKLETMDSGFSAYCGYIHVECAHRHPVLLCFVSHLLRDHLYPTKRLSKARHKWHLAVFLLNNPTLIYQRNGFLLGLHEKKRRTTLIGRNANEMHVEQPPILAHRESFSWEKELGSLWEGRRF